MSQSSALHGHGREPNMHQSQGLDPKAHKACIAALWQTQGLRALNPMGIQVLENMRQSQCPNPKAACSIHGVLELCTLWTWQCWEKCVKGPDAEILPQSCLPPA